MPSRDKPARFEPDQIVLEHPSSFGIILSSGDITFDVVWLGGSTSRYRYATGRYVRLATEEEIHAERAHTIPHLRAEVAKAREERRTGARIKRGQVWPGGSRR